MTPTPEEAAEHKNVRNAILLALREFNASSQTLEARLRIQKPADNTPNRTAYYVITIARADNPRDQINDNPRTRPSRPPPNPDGQPQHITGCSENQSS